MAFLIILSRNYCSKQIKSANFVMKANTIKIGDTASILRTITQDDLTNFANLTGDNNPIHVNSTKNIVHGAFLNGLVSSVLGTKMPGPGSIVLEQNFRFPNTCFVGDTVNVQIKVLSIKRIILCEYTCTTNGKNIVMEGEAKIIKR